MVEDEDVSAGGQVLQVEAGVVAGAGAMHHPTPRIGEEQVHLLGEGPRYEEFAHAAHGVGSHAQIVDGGGFCHQGGGEGNLEDKDLLTALGIGQDEGVGACFQAGEDGALLAVRPGVLVGRRAAFHHHDDAARGIAVVFEDGGVHYGEGGRHLEGDADDAVAALPVGEHALVHTRLPHHAPVREGVGITGADAHGEGVQGQRQALQFQAVEGAIATQVHGHVVGAAVEGLDGGHFFTGAPSEGCIRGQRGVEQDGIAFAGGVIGGTKEGAEGPAFQHHSGEEDISLPTCDEILHAVATERQQAVQQDMGVVIGGKHDVDAVDGQGVHTDAIDQPRDGSGRHEGGTDHARQQQAAVLQGLQIGDGIEAGGEAEQGVGGGAQCGVEGVEDEIFLPRGGLIAPRCYSEVVGGGVGEGWELVSGQGARPERIALEIELDDRLFLGVGVPNGEQGPVGEGHGIGDALGGAGVELEAPEGVEVPGKAGEDEVFGVG